MRSISMGAMAILVVLLAGALALAGAMPAGATTLLRMNAGNLMDSAELIFVGEVLDVSSVPVADGSYAFTFVTFDVSETLKGEIDGTQLALRFDGGQVGDRVIEYEGMPTFQPGQQVLLFVEGNGKVGCPVLGWWQGRLDFVSGPDSSVLVDSFGGIVTGVADGEWLRVAPEELLERQRSPRSEPSVEVLWTDGVEIEAPAEDAVRQARLADSVEVLEALRTQLRARRTEKSFQRGVRVESAYTDEIPATVEFRPTTAPVAQ